MRDVVVNVLAVAGCLVMCAGLALVWLPLGIVAVGASLVALAVLVAAPR